jgi:sucrose phosphorylase
MPSIEILKYIKDILRVIYSKETASEVFGDLKNLMDVYGRAEVIKEKRKKYNDRVLLNEKDAVLITYPDTIYEEGEKPLVTLLHFLKKHVRGAVTGVHILPYFPSSSDGGFAVINYKEVDPRFGSWGHIQNIARDYRLMVDLVINHVSSKSKWFAGFLQGDKRYREYFIWTDKPIDMPKVFRPRESPLFSKFETAIGEKYVWTTFSADQIDLNFKNPEVLLKIIDVLLFYLSQGIEIIRLDAIGYVWKEPHTSCVNLAKTHQIVKLLRRIL